MPGKGYKGHRILSIKEKGKGKISRVPSCAVDVAKGEGRAVINHMTKKGKNDGTE